MSVAAKIIACCFWFGLVFLLSLFGNDVFSRIVDFVKERIIRTEIPPQIDFAITIIPWNVFVSLLLWIPFLFIKKRRVNVAAEISDAIVFFFFLLGWNLLGVLNLWVLFPESIGNYSGVPSLSAIKPYAIYEGWSPFEFWCAWWGFIALSNLLSIGMAFLIRRSRKANEPLPWS
jgi:hypothetical protein